MPASEAGPRPADRGEPQVREGTGQAAHVWLEMRNTASIIFGALFFSPSCSAVSLVLLYSVLHSRRQVLLNRAKI